MAFRFFVFLIFMGFATSLAVLRCADGENRHARGYELCARQSSDELAPCKRNRCKNAALNLLSLFPDMHRKMLACIDLACCSSPTMFSGGSAFPSNPREVSARCKQHKNPGKSSMSRCRQISNPGILGADGTESQEI